MQVAVFSDIHGNDIGFETMLADAGDQRIDKYVCLGDAIQGGATTCHRVLARLRELNCPVVMGNSDAWLLSGEETGAEAFTDERRERLDAIRLWSLAQLSPADRDFIRGFQPTVELELEDRKKLLCFHGSPASFDDVMLPELATGTLGQESWQLRRARHDRRTYARSIRAPHDAGLRIFFNPGSVGVGGYSHHQPDDNFRTDPWAEYAILAIEQGKQSLEFRRLPIDLNRLITVYKESGCRYSEQAITEYSGE